MQLYIKYEGNHGLELVVHRNDTDQSACSSQHYKETKWKIRM